MDQIPFRVVVEILSYHEVSIRSSTPEFELFGFFVKDPMRKIFFLFSSVEISRKTMALVSPRNLKGLKLKNTGKEMLDSVVSTSTEFENLVTVRVYDGGIGDAVGLCGNAYMFAAKRIMKLQYGDLLSKENAFPSLKRLSFEFCQFPATKCDMSSFHEKNEELWSRLEFFSILSHQPGIYQLDHPDSFNLLNLKEVNFLNHPKSWVNLKELDISIHPETSTTITAPKLRILRLRNCKNVEVINQPPSLTHVSLSDIIEMKKILNNHNRSVVQSLSLENIHDNLSLVIYPNISFVFEKKTHSDFDNLQKLNVSHFDISKTIFPQSLESINLLVCQGFDFMLLRTCANLRKLTLSHLDFEEKSEDVSFSPVSSNLHFLKLVKNKRLKDEFFQKNNFEALEQLILLENNGENNSQDKGITGQAWNDMPNLQILQIFRHEHIQENKLIESGFKFSKLKIIQLNNVKNFSGRSIHSNQMRKIEFFQCEDVDDSLFQNNSFEHLESLYISNTKNIIGRGWQMMTNLQKLELLRCTEMTDDLFQRQNLSKLKKIILHHNVNIHGVGWKFLPQLKELDISDDDEQLDISDFSDFHSKTKKPFGKKCVFRRDYQKIEVFED